MVVSLVLGPTGCAIDELTEDDVGTERYCEGARRWPNEFAAIEDDLIEGIEALRRTGARCDEVRYNPVTSLELVPELRCAARLHATDLAVHDAIGPAGSDGSTPLSRANLSGYDGIPRYEMTGANFTDADSVLAAWIAEPVHCAALLDRKLRHFGVGHSQTANGDATAFVLELGEPRS